MKDTLTDLLILTVIVIGANVLGWLLCMPAHETAIWGLIGWLVAAREKK